MGNKNKLLLLVAVCGLALTACVEDSVAFDYTQDEKQLYLSPNAYDEFLSPIPITPELLRELGFVNTSCTRRITYTKGSEYEDSWIEFKNFKDRWEVFVSKDNWDGRFVCRYLHEAEAFLVLYGVELIKE